MQIAVREYLEPSEYIDWKEPGILAQAELLSIGANGDLAVADACFRFVRDQIRHSQDWMDVQVTCRASDVLKYRTGFCYAKSHLLAALLRANGIPAALCYQRLRGANGKFCLHGLNAVHLTEYGWYRVDPRGNKFSVDAQFTPPKEQLAFELHDGEEDIPGFLSVPLQQVIEALSSCGSVEALSENLPDLTAGEI